MLYASNEISLVGRHQIAGLQLFGSRVIVQTLSLVTMPKFSLELGSLPIFILASDHDSIILVLFTEGKNGKPPSGKAVHAWKRQVNFLHDLLRNYLIQENGYFAIICLAMLIKSSREGYCLY